MAPTIDAVVPHWHEDGDISAPLIVVAPEWLRAIDARSFSNLGRPCVDAACAMRVALTSGEYDYDEFIAYEGRSPRNRFLVTSREQDGSFQKWIVEATGPEAAHERGARSEGILVDMAICGSERLPIESVVRIDDDADQIPGAMPTSRYGLLRAAAAAVIAHTSGDRVEPWAIEALECVVRGDTVAASTILADQGAGALLGPPEGSQEAGRASASATRCCYRIHQ